MKNRIINKVLLMSPLWTLDWIIWDMDKALLLIPIFPLSQNLLN